MIWLAVAMLTPQGLPLQALAPQALAQSSLPSIQVEWRKDAGVLIIDAPAGEHLAPDAPMGGWLDVDGAHLQVQGTGAAFKQGVGLSLPGDGPHTVQGELDLSLCVNGGTSCRPVSVGFIGRIDGRRGSQYLAVHPPVVELIDELGAAPALSAEQAFVSAQSSGKLVLLDFSAVWCPPCNQLAAEVLHVDRPVLRDFEVAIIDADLVSSWGIKDQYQVGGYPTVVIATADGVELSRMVGYPGQEPFEQWLAQAAAGELVGVDQALALEQRTPAQSAALALRLVEMDRESEARELLSQPGVLEHVDARVARAAIRFHLAKTGATPGGTPGTTAAESGLEDARWLAERAPERMLEWGWEVLELELSQADSDLFFGALSQAMRATGSATELAELLYMQATLTPDPAVSQALLSAAASSLESSFTGDPELDRAQWGFLAHLYEEAGDPERALALLQQACGVYPHELTFFHAAAGLLMRQDRYAEGLPYGHAALALSYGDQRLRAAVRLAQLMDGVGDTQAGVDVLRAEIGGAQRPDPELQVRTHRYFLKAEAELEELEGKL